MRLDYRILIAGQVHVAVIADSLGDVICIVQFEATVYKLIAERLVLNV